MAAKFFDHIKGSLSNDNGDSNENGEKSNRFISANLASLHDCDMKRPNLTRPLYGVGEHNTKFFRFSFF